MKLKNMLYGCLILSAANFSYAKEINIDALMKENINPWLKKQISVCKDKNPIPSCYGSLDSQCSIKRTQALAKRAVCSAPFKADNPIKNITIKEGNVRYSKVQNSPIPSAVKKRTFIYENCSSTPLKTSPTEKITSLEGAIITTKDSVKSSSGIIPKFDVGFEIGLSASHEVYFERATNSTQQTTKEYTLNIEKTINPYTTLLVVQEVRELYSWFEFEGDVFLDGLVSNKEQYSNIVPNNLITVKGEIFNTSSELSSLKYQEIALPTSCNVIQSPALQKTQSDQMPVGAASLAGSPMLFINGMVISTANKVGNVQVRFKSLGADYCKVNFYSSFGVYSVLARPEKMSEWENMITYTNSKTTPISSDSDCESGFLAEVRLN